jgi:hypothetical protein
MKYKPILHCLALTLVLVCPPSWAGVGAVAMPDRFSAEAAEEILRRGGNAVDAAITAAFVLAVTYPEAGNIGGGGFMISHMAGENAFLDFRERAPQQAHRDMYLDEGGNFVQKDSLVGGRASGAGFVMNNEMDDFSAKVGVKNKFGVVGNMRISIEPGMLLTTAAQPNTGTVEYRARQDDACAHPGFHGSLQHRINQRPASDGEKYQWWQRVEPGFIGPFKLGARPAQYKYAQYCEKSIQGHGGS